MCNLSFLAISYFFLSFSPLILDSAARKTYLPLAFSFLSSLKWQSHVASGLEITLFQECPTIGQIGIGFSGPMLILTNSGTILDFNLPA